MILDLKQTSGVLCREPGHTKLKLTFLSGKWNERKVSVKVINWTNLSPTIIYSKTIYVPVSGVYLIEIPLVTDYYSDDMNIDLYEVNISPNIFGMRVNLFEQ